MALANEWAPHGVNVNAIARIPAGRWGESSDLAGAAVFLASAASDTVHGIALPVDGGWLARY
jgi:2-deoxy-D-gluconate 3-dehydrogenase